LWYTHTYTHTVLYTHTHTHTHTHTVLANNMRLGAAKWGGTCSFPSEHLLYKSRFIRSRIHNVRRRQYGRYRYLPEDTKVGTLNSLKRAPSRPLSPSLKNFREIPVSAVQGGTRICRSRRYRYLPFSEITIGP